MRERFAINGMRMLHKRLTEWQKRKCRSPFPAIVMITFDTIEYRSASPPIGCCQI